MDDDRKPLSKRNSAPQGRYHIWDEKGNPIPVDAPIYNKEAIHALPLVIFAEAYTPKRNQGRCDQFDCPPPEVASCPVHGDLLPGEASYIGMTKLEVAERRQIESAADGNLDAYREMKDRTIGKPKQTTETLQVTASLQEYLEQSAKQGDPTTQVKQPSADTIVVDVDPTPNTNEDWL